MGKIKAEEYEKWDKFEGEPMSDYISRQAAIDALEGLCDIVCQYSKKQRSVMCGACPLGSAFDTIEELPSAQRWIPCNERLPENGRIVLVTDWGETGFGRRYDGRWWNCGDVLKDVSAWMPLPEPWKG